MASQVGSLFNANLKRQPAEAEEKVESIIVFAASAEPLSSCGPWRESGRHIDIGRNAPFGSESCRK